MRPVPQALALLLSRQQLAVLLMEPPCLALRAQAMGLLLRTMATGSPSAFAP